MRVDEEKRLSRETHISFQIRINLSISLYLFAEGNKLPYEFFIQPVPPTGSRVSDLGLITDQNK